MNKDLPKPTVISALNSRQSAQAEIKALEIQASLYYGNHYLYDEDFHRSGIARAMETAAAEVAYYNRQIQQSINHN